MSQSIFYLCHPYLAKHNLTSVPATLLHFNLAARPQGTAPVVVVGPSELELVLQLYVQPTFTKLALEPLLCFLLLNPERLKSLVTTRNVLVRKI